MYQLHMQQASNTAFCKTMYTKGNLTVKAYLK